MGQDGLVPNGEIVMASSVDQSSHGAGANGLKKEIKEPGECQGDKSTTCG